VVIVGGGFGGLKAAKTLRHKPVRVTLVDKRNFHLFQPLLYQVATGGLSPGDIAYPLRAAFAGAKNIEVLAAGVVELAGAIAGLAKETMVNDFRHIDPRETRIILLEGTDRILSTFLEELSAKAEKALVQGGIEVRKGTLVIDPFCPPA
jgi:NADH dehydrogenase FAD-containing subunit